MGYLLVPDPTAPVLLCTLNLLRFRHALKMSASPFLLVAAAAACVFWALWRRQTPATALNLDLPLVGFGDGEDAFDDVHLRERYTKETGLLLRKGYEKVRLVSYLPAFTHMGTY